MAGPRRNLELKARDRDPARSLRACEELGASDEGRLVQTDTYFAAVHGRLKLREQDGAESQLIAYERLDRREQRESRYEIVAVPDPAALQRALASALGVVTVVRKTRRLFLLEGVRIHLDRVEGLGDFVEFEGVADAGEDPARFADTLRDLRAAFAIADGDLVAGSYCDLLLASSSAAA